MFKKNKDRDSQKEVILNNIKPDDEKIERKLTKEEIQKDANAKKIQDNILESKEREKEEIERKEKIERVLKNSFLGKYLEMDNVTDISFNGTDLFIQDNVKGRYKVDDNSVSEDDVFNLGYRIANLTDKNFTNSDSILDTELEFLRLNFVHRDVSPFGTTMAVRVSKPRLAVQSIANLADKDVERLIQLFMLSDTNVVISGKTGSGKSICNSEIIPTPEGNLLMGDIKVGDYVYDRYGKPTRVLGVYPQGKLDVYEVILKDGRSVRCSKDHLWGHIDNESKELETITVENMMLNGLKNEEGEYNYYIPLSVESEELFNCDEDKIEIVEIKNLGYQEEMTCIRVEHKDHLFEVGTGVLTHNTELVRHVII